MQGPTKSLLHLIVLQPGYTIPATPIKFCLMTDLFFVVDPFINKGHTLTINMIWVNLSLKLHTIEH